MVKFDNNDPVFNTIGIVDGEERLLAEITTKSQSELYNRMKNYGRMGDDWKIGNFCYITGCGYDYFFVVVAKDKVKVVEQREY